MTTATTSGADSGAIALVLRVPSAAFAPCIVATQPAALPIWCALADALYDSGLARWLGDPDRRNTPATIVAAWGWDAERVCRAIERQRGGPVGVRVTADIPRQRTGGAYYLDFHPEYFRVADPGSPANAIYTSRGGSKLFHPFLLDSAG